MRCYYFLAEEGISLLYSSIRCHKAGASTKYLKPTQQQTATLDRVCYEHLKCVVVLTPGWMTLFNKCLPISIILAQ